jgi:hypothetical protein
MTVSGMLDFYPISVRLNALEEYGMLSYCAVDYTV